jgi:hypothetical protein
MNIGILKILDFQARAKRRRDELWYYFRWEMVSDTAQSPKISSTPLCKLIKKPGEFLTKFSRNSQPTKI